VSLSTIARARRQALASDGAQVAERIADACHGAVLVLNILTRTLFSAPAYRTYGAIIAEGKDPVGGFKMSLALRDMWLALAAADAGIVPLPIASLVRDHFVEAVAGGNGDAEWSRLGLLAARRAGIEAVAPRPSA
jgi:3-hydroxyisobutyrate dehydrogenase-like beta-hydroxyacid dehydrogenase